MATFSALEKLGLVFAVVLILYIVKFIIGVVYTYAIGPALNKVDFKSKGKWACKYFRCYLLTRLCVLENFHS